MFIAMGMQEMDFTLNIIDVLKSEPLDQKFSISRQQ